MTENRTARRLALLAGAGAATVLLAAVPAFAHVEVESKTAQALAQNAEIDFEAESESATEGITGVRVVLPEGIAPGDVAYGKGPAGWVFAATADGFVLKGPAVKAGVNAEYSIVVKQLPDAKELPFKTLQTYSDGRTDRWIELDDTGENPAPILKLKAAAPGAKPVASASPSPSPSAPATPTPSAAEPTVSVPASPQAEATEKKDDDGGLSGAAWAGIAVGLLAMAAAVAFFVRRKGAAAAE